MDALDDILKTFSLENSELHFSLLTAPWGIGFAPCERKAADAGFYVVTEGECFLRLENEKNAPLIRLSAGDFALISQGDAHSLRAAPHSPVHPLEDWLTRVGLDEKGTVLFGEKGGGGAQTRILCGTVRFSGRTTNPLLDSLPPLVVVRGEDGKAVDWLEGTMAFLLCESRSQRPAAPTVIARLCDILFIQAIRALLTPGACVFGEAPPPGWLNAVRDPDISRAVSAIHAAPARDWTVETLAREAALSRSTFAARFTQLMGEPPLRYLTRWRMHRAAVALRWEGASMGEIARSVGYESEAAFSKTFKRQTGTAPGTYRRNPGSPHSVSPNV